MIRRGSGRTPPYILVGLVLVIVVLGFNYWTLSSQNADLQQELEKLQSEVKISAMKQDQSEKKNAALQETVHEMDELSNRLNKKIQADDESLRKSDQDLQKLKYEITSLKNKVTKMQEQINSLNQEAEDREIELSKAKETNSHLVSERDDAIDAIAEKDAMINTLKRQLEQVTVKRSKLILSLATCNSDLMTLKKECEETQRASDDLANIIVQTKRDVQLEFESKLSSLTEELSEEKTRSNTLQFSIDDLQKKLTDTVGDLADSQDKVSQLEASIHDLGNDKVKEKTRADSLENTVKDLNQKLTESNAKLTECLESEAILKASASANEAEIEKAQDEAAAARREKMAVAKPKIIPGAMNIPEIEQKEPFLGPGQLDYISRGAVRTRDIGLQGINFRRDLPILPRVPPNAVRKKPRFSVADMAKEIAGPQNNAGGNGVEGAGVLAAPQPVEQVNPPANNGGNQLMAPAAPPVMERPGPPGVVNNKPIQAPDHPVDGQGPQNDVLAPPPQHLQALESREKDGSRGKRDEEEYDGVLPGFHDNLDAAIDEEEKIVEDMMDDQDEEGNEIKQNEEANEGDNIHEEKRDILKGGNILGALEVPQPIHGEGFNHQDMNVEDDPGNQANYYDANFENKIRNLGRPPDLH